MPNEVQDESSLSAHPHESDEVRRVMARVEFEEYNRDFLQGFLDWYGTETQSFEKRSRKLQWLSVFFAALATVIAAFPTNLFEYFLPHQLASIGELIAKFAVVAVAATSTFFMSILARHGVEDGYRMRELGRAEVNNVAQKAKLRLLNIPMTVAQRVEYQEGVADAMEKIEKKYGGPQKTGYNREMP
jgi:hypothetical protein